MGLGDEIMAAGRAEKLWRETGQRVAIVDASMRPREHDVWTGNPAIDQSSSLTLTDCPRGRGYIDRWEGSRSVLNMTYHNRDHPGSIYIPDEYLRWAASVVESGCVVIEPIVQRPSSLGKDWGFKRWAKVAEQLENVVQLGADHARPVLPGAQFIKTETFWHAAAIVRHAAVTLTPEGGLHHIAGALKRPAVVIYGGFTHPLITGYDGHECLYVDVPGSPCGEFGPCDHCRLALEMITVDMVLERARIFI